MSGTNIIRPLPHSNYGIHMLWLGRVLLEWKFWYELSMVWETRGEWII